MENIEARRATLSSGKEDAICKEYKMDERNDVGVSKMKRCRKRADKTGTDSKTVHAPPFRYEEEAEYLSHH